MTGSNGNGRPRTIQEKMMDVLSDRREHYAEELHKCLSDDLGPVTNIHAHLTAIRKKLYDEGQFLLHSRRDGGRILYSLRSLYVEVPSRG